MLKPRIIGLAVALLTGAPGSLAVSVVRASPLRDASHEWAFAASLADTNDVGTLIDLDLQWQWNSPSGRHQVGVLSSYDEVAPDQGSDFNAFMLGPVYTFNWTPSARVATGLAEISLGGVGGDAGDDYEGYGQIAVGAKIFAGDSAAVTMRLSRQVLWGMDGVEDLETIGLGAGISIFTGHRPAPFIGP